MEFPLQNRMQLVECDTDNLVRFLWTLYLSAI